MPQNLEIKSSVVDPAETRKKIICLPAVASGLLIQKDTYYNVPSGRLKLREIQGAQSELIYYERTEEQKDRFSHFDIFRTSDPAALHLLLSRAFGIRAVVEKRRELFMYGDTRIHLDEVKNLGSFLEFEIPVTDSSEGEGRDILQHLIGALSLHPENFIKGSYVDLITMANSKWQMEKYE